MRILTCYLGFLGILMCLAPALADGEPTARLSDSGVIVPVEDRRAHVIAQRITLTLPPPERAWDDPAVVRVEYLLSTDQQEPLALTVGWPTTGIRYEGSAYHPRCRPAIKFDGRPVGYNLLSLDDLARQYTDAWMKRIGQLLETRPALKKQVAAVRDTAVERGEDWLQGEGVSALARWLRDNQLARDYDAEPLARGLLGAQPRYQHERRYAYVQQALSWLDPQHQRVDVYDELSERWGHEALMLDPDSGQLTDIRSAMLQWEPPFAVFRFAITLRPREKHRLVVQYGQFLGDCHRFSGGWYGLVYLMEPARRWGRWERTAIELRVPSAWRTVAIRPPADPVKTENGFGIYRINMQRPEENLYLSVRQEAPRSLGEARWARIVGTFAGLWTAGRLDEAKEVILTEGRLDAETALPRLLRELSPTDPVRLDVAFTMFILGVDTQSSRAALVEPMRGSDGPMADAQAIHLVGSAYRSRTDLVLLNALLDLTPRVKGPAIEAMHQVLGKLARTMPRALLAALRAKPQRVWDGVADRLSSGMRRKHPVDEYPALARVAADQGDPARARAQQLLVAIAEARERRLRQNLMLRMIPEAPRGLHLPTKALAALAEAYPNWHVMGTSGFDDGVVAALRDRFGRDAGPQHCSGDFDGNGLEDVALLMRCWGEAALVAVHHQDGGQWTARELRRFPFNRGLQRGYDGFTIYLTPRAPGTVAYWQADDGGKTGRLALEHDGIEMHVADKASVLYYWHEQGYASVQTGD